MKQKEKWRIAGGTTLKDLFMGKTGARCDGQLRKAVLVRPGHLLDIEARIHLPQRKRRGAQLLHEVVEGGAFKFKSRGTLPSSRRLR